MHDIHDIIDKYNETLLNNNFGSFSELENIINNDNVFKSFDEDEQFVILDDIKKKFNNKDKLPEKVEIIQENNNKEVKKSQSMFKSKQPVYEFIGKQEKQEKKPYRFNSSVLTTNNIAKKIYIDSEDVSEGALLSSTDKAVFINAVPEELYLKRKIQFEWLRKIESPEQRTTPWYEQRNKSITASDCGCVLGENKYEQVYNFVFKKVFGSTFGTNMDCYHGKKFENVVTLMYEFVNDVIVDEFGLLGHPVYNFLAASPDGICTPYCRDKVTPNPLVGRMIEIKCPFRRKIKYSGTIKGDICPDYYWCQVQLQLECCDLDECDFVQCNIEEYSSRKDFLDDTNTECDYKSKKYGLERGVVIELMPTKLNEDDYLEQVVKRETKDGIVYDKYHIIKNDAIYDKASFIYQPKLDMTLKELDEWIIQEMEKLSKRPEVKLNKIIYWRFVERNSTLIVRDKQWFANNLETMRKIWAYVEILRKNNKIANEWKLWIEAQNKKFNDKIINKLIELIKNEGLFEQVINAIKEVSPEINQELEKLITPSEIKSDSNNETNTSNELVTSGKVELNLEEINNVINSENIIENKYNSSMINEDLLIENIDEKLIIKEDIIIKKTNSKGKKEPKEKEPKEKKPRKKKIDEPINIIEINNTGEKINSKKSSKTKPKIYKSIVIDISDDE